MQTRERVIRATATLLTAAPEGDVSTRDICQAAGVGAPVIYRYFGDKNGLLSAVVDFGFEQYLQGKRAAIPSADPVDDLRSGWDNHVAFALANPNFYTLMYSPAREVRPNALGEAHQLLTAIVERVAAEGRLRTDSALAAQMIMSANTGVALALIHRPEINTRSDLSARVRDAVIDSVTSPSAGVDGSRVDELAYGLSAMLRADRVPGLSEPEQALMGEWLHRIRSVADN